jgi:hypothetical protein
MTRNSGLKTWPPLWMTTQNKAVGEVGSLEDVMMSDLIDNKVFVVMQYQGLRYMGFMSFDDRPFCREIYTLLKSKIGVSIKEIGDIDLSHNLHSHGSSD